MSDFSHKMNEKNHKASIFRKEVDKTKECQRREKNTFHETPKQLDI